MFRESRRFFHDSLLVALAVVAALAGCARHTIAAPPAAPVASAAPAVAPVADVFHAPPPEARALILYTASVQGYVEPCGCTGDPLGGVARMAAAVADAERKWPDRVLFLDAGDMLFEHLEDSSPADACQAAARDDLLVDTYAKLGLAATALGPLDDVRGAEFRDARMARAGIVTLSATPLPRALTSGAKLEDVMVKKLGAGAVATTIAVTAFRVDDAAGVDAARAALAAAVAKTYAAGDRIDAFIVLAQAPRNLTRAVMRGVAGVDVVIQGRAGEVPVPPEPLEGGAVLVSAGLQAQHLGVLELNLEGRPRGGPDRKPLALDDKKAQADARKKVLEVRVHELEKQVSDATAAKKEFLAQRLAAARAELAALDGDAADAGATGPSIKVSALPLPRGFAEDPGVRAALAAYTKSIPTLVATCEANAVCPSVPEGQPTYVGALQCKPCHQPAYDFWQAQQVKLPGKDASGRPITRVEGHAHAWETLIVDGRDKDRGCVACHSVGFGMPGGPCKTSDVVARGLAGVQCESCHGPGSLHALTGARDDVVVRAPDEARCRTCHHVPHIPTTESFVMNERLELILGKGHGEKRRASLEARP